MNPSLTLLLPVYNVQSTLSAMVAEILEVVADRNEQFELLLVDDGSVDATAEVVDELIRRYPQVRAVRHGAHLGHEAAVRTGLRHSKADAVVLRGATAASQRTDEEMFPRRAPEQVHAPSRPIQPNYLQRLRAFASGK